MRAEHHYLIGVDEILTSYFRCGRRFAHTGRLPEIDLMTLSKALSYGCFPTGAALVSDEVVDAARAANPGLVEELRTCHANRLGAHFGLHAVAQADALGLAEQVPRLSRIVQDGIGAMGRRRSVGRRFAEGLLGQIEVLMPRALRRLLDQEQAAMLWWITQARVFIIYDVFLLPVNATDDDIRHVMRQAVRLSRTGRWTVAAQLALFMAREQVAAIRRRRG
jgi:adenosylmethionine-8-amino-7-oxononanoate aminotransferase